MKRLGLITVIVVSVASCTKLRHTWVKEGYDGGYFQKVAVVGIAKDLGERLDYEKQTVALLEEKGIEAVEGVALFPQVMTPEERSADSIQQKIKLFLVDAILTVSVVSADEGRFEGEYIIPEDYDAFGKFYAHRYSRMYTRGYLANSERIVMEALLYDMNEEEGQTLVWRGEMAILNPKENQATKDRFIRRVVNQLTSEDILRASKQSIAFKLP